MEAYPTFEGMPLPTYELDLLPTRLIISPENQSNHHLFFTHKNMGRLVMTQTLRDLESEQEMMQNDQHNIGKHCLHALYTPPDMPTPLQMLENLEIAKLSGSQLNIRHKGLGYVKTPFTDNLWNDILTEYERIK